MLRSPNFKSASLFLAVLAAFTSGCSDKMKETTNRTKENSQKSAPANKSPRQPDDLKSEKKITSLFDEIKKIKNTQLEQVSKPKSFSECEKLIEKCLEVNAYKAAIKYATYAIEMKPERFEGYFWRGKIRAEEPNSEDEAILDLEKAASINPSSRKTQYMLANLYDLKGMRSKAMNAVNRAIKLSPDRIGQYVFRASMFRELGKKELALKDLSTCIKLKPDNIEIYLRRGSYLEEYGKYDEALSDYSKCVELTMKDFKITSGEILKQRARLLSKLGRHKEAIKDLNMVVKNIPDEDDALRLRGNEYAKLDKYEQAIADYTRAIRMSPDYARASYLARSKAYRKIGKTKLAEKDLNKVKELSGKRAEKPVYEVR